MSFASDEQLVIRAVARLAEFGRTAVDQARSGHSGIANAVIAGLPPAFNLAILTPVDRGLVRRQVKRLRARGVHGSRAGSDLVSGGTGTAVPADRDRTGNGGCGLSEPLGLGGATWIYARAESPSATSWRGGPVSWSS